MRKKNNEAFIYLVMVVLAIVILWGVLRLINPTEPKEADAVYYNIYEDDYVRVNIAYLDKNKVSDDGTTFVSMINEYSNDILLLVDNLREDGLIFLPTPTVTIIGSNGEVADTLRPFVTVAGLANPLDSTYISFTNPIPDRRVKRDKYSYIIDLQYQYVYYDRVTLSNELSVTLNTEVISRGFLYEAIEFALRSIKYLISGFLVVILLIFRRKRR